MRNPDRISPTLDAVSRAWSRNPDLRLGQLLYNAAHAASGGSLGPCPELFYLEDDVLIAHLTAIGDSPSNQAP